MLVRPWWSELEYVIADDGVFWITLEVIDADTGESDRDRTELLVANVAPTVELTAAPVTGREGETLYSRPPGLIRGSMMRLR